MIDNERVKYIYIVAYDDDTVGICEYTAKDDSYELASTTTFTKGREDEAIFIKKLSVFMMDHHPKESSYYVVAYPDSWFKHIKKIRYTSYMYGTLRTMLRMLNVRMRSFNLFEVKKYMMDKSEDYSDIFTPAAYKAAYAEYPDNPMICIAGLAAHSIIRKETGKDIRTKKDTSIS